MPPDEDDGRLPVPVPRMDDVGTVKVGARDEELDQMPDDDAEGALPVPVRLKVEDVEPEAGPVETPVDWGTLPVPGREGAEDVPLPYGAEVKDDEEPPVPVPVTSPDVLEMGALAELAELAQGTWTETVTVDAATQVCDGTSVLVTVSVTVWVGNLYPPPYPRASFPLSPRAPTALENGQSVMFLCQGSGTLERVQR